MEKLLLFQNHIKKSDQKIIFPDHSLDEMH